MCAAVDIIDFVQQNIGPNCGILSINEGDSSSPYYSKHVKEDHIKLVHSVIDNNQENLKMVKDNLLKIKRKIVNFKFENFGYNNIIENGIIENGLRQLTYGMTYKKNLSEKIIFSGFFFNLDCFDRTYAIIHEFAHFVLVGSSLEKELYINDFLNNLPLDNKRVKKIINSPDFYVLLCYLAQYKAEC